MQVICHQCGETMSEHEEYREPGLHFMECDGCGETCIVVDPPEDPRMDAADYYLERSMDR